MDKTSTLIALVWVHWFADFVLQSDWMAINKSRRSWVLTAHVAVYAACLIPFGLKFAGVNFLAHWVTDFASSRITSKLWQTGSRHWFFVVIGVDQALHLTTLVLTYAWL